MLEAERILIVDDELGPRESIRMILNGKYRIIVADSGRRALEEITRRPVSVAILDIRMPEMNGLELLEAIKEVDPRVEVLMVTGYANVDSAVKAMRFGAYDYLEKPFDKDELEALIDRGITRRRRRVKVSEKIKKYRSGIFETLVASMDAKNSYTTLHSERAAQLAVLIGKKMNLATKDLDNLEHTALLHDIGKIGVSEMILTKAGPLTSKEFDEIRKHPVTGARILEPIDAAKEIIPAVYHHHERYEGGGYPDGIMGEDIPLSARILAVADALSAMMSDRPYRKRLEKEKIFSELEKNAGSQFDPKVVEAATEILTKNSDLFTS